MATKHVSLNEKGFDAVRMQFNMLPRRMRDRVMKTAIRRGADAFKKRMAWMAPVEFGHLRDAISVRVKQYKGGSVTFSATGAKSKWIPMDRRIRWTKTGTVNPALYAPLTNKGIHASKEGWKDRAFTLGKGVAQKRFETFLIRGINREGKKLGMKPI